MKLIFNYDFNTNCYLCFYVVFQLNLIEANQMNKNQREKMDMCKCGWYSTSAEFEQLQYRLWFTIAGNLKSHLDIRF